VPHCPSSSGLPDPRGALEDNYALSSGGGPLSAGSDDGQGIQLARIRQRAGGSQWQHASKKRRVTPSV